MTDPIADRLAVQDVMTKYAQGVDTRDLDLYATCFAEDMTFSGFSGAEGRGREAWVAYVRNALERYGRTQHLMGNQVVELRGDEATMRTYVQATHVLASDGKSTMTLWATYHDELKRINGEWKITDHRLDPAARETRMGQ